MEYSIDYLSFTIPCEKLEFDPLYTYGSIIEKTVVGYLGDLTDALLDNQPFDILRGRAPYVASWGRADGGVRIFGSPKLTHVLVEITGTGCKTLRSHDALESILSLVAARVSRIDMAVDIECNTKPTEFAEQRNVERFKSISNTQSETGDTYYVGSWKSDRFARVYRFAPPHPRSKTLRVEHVYKAAAAKAYARTILSSGSAAAAAGSGLVWGWSHPEWNTGDITPMETVSGQTRKTNKNTVNWLYDTVASSVVKQVKKGDLDLEDYIQYLRKIVDNATK